MPSRTRAFPNGFGAALSVLVSASFLNCASQSAASRGTNAETATSGERGNPETNVPRTVVTPDDALTIEELMTRAERRFKAGEYVTAAHDFDRVYTAEPNGAYAPLALFGAAESRDMQGSNEEALAKYENLARRFPSTALSRTALVRSIRLLAYLERFQRAGEVADRILESRAPLGAFDQIVVYGGKGLALVDAHDLEAATYYIAKGRTVVEDRGLDRAGELPRDLAMLYYGLGEVKRLQAEAIRFVPLPADFADALERRCQFLLDAQHGYSDAMRAYDSHWSAMAGYRVGELYQSLHRDLMQIPPPTAATTPELRHLFEGAMRLRYSILLEKAKAMMAHTLSMAERTGERSPWIDRAREAKRQIEVSLSDEQAVLAKLPYTRAELEAAFADLAKRNAAAKSGAPPSSAPPSTSSP
jgi:tetratricopeptide (TPR) repeat protein